MKYVCTFFYCLVVWVCSSVWAHAERKEPVLGAQIIDRLIAPETRLEAFREVVIAKQSDRPVHDWSALPMEAFELYHTQLLVTLCPQLGGRPPLYLVTYRTNREAFSRHYSKHESFRSGEFSPVLEAHKPSALTVVDDDLPLWTPASDHPHCSVPPEAKLEDCVLVFLTHEGQVVWPFRGDNVGDGDVLKDLNGDGRYERVFTANFGVYDTKKGEPDIWVQTLRVEAVEPESERSLHVVLNWHNKKSAGGETWGWAVRDLDGDGIDEIIIGPQGAKASQPEPTVVYRWDAATQRYLGPEGSYEDHYLLFDPQATLWDGLRSVKAAGGLQYQSIAQAQMPAVQPSNASAAVHGQSRIPYQPQSLATLSDEALLDFMCGLKPHVQRDTDVALAPVASARFEFQAEWFALPPKEAAFAFAEANQSVTHRNKYVLFYPTNLTKSPCSDWIVLSALNGAGHDVIRVLGEDAGQRLSVRMTRPLPEKYPNGDFSWEWKSSAFTAEQSVWLSETLWWLAQLRSEPKVPERGYGMGRSLTTDCYPSYMETAPPGVRLLQDGEASLVDIQTERVSRMVSLWRGAYGPDVYVGLADTLYRKLSESVDRRAENALTLDQVFERFPMLLEDLQTRRIPPQLAKAMIRSAGDAAAVSVRPLLDELAAAVPATSELELEWQRLADAIAALPSNSDVETYRAKAELQAQLDSIDPARRAEVWGWLREPLHFSIRQLEAADDVDALSAWAQQAGAPGALWALQRLKQLDEARWRKVLADVFVEQVDWRSKVLRFFAYKDPVVAKELVDLLPRERQLEVFPDLVGSKQSADLDAELIEDLLATIQSQALDVQVRLRALRKLIPQREVDTLEGQEVDLVLREVMVQAFQNMSDPWPERNFAAELGLVLLLRDQVPLPIELYLQGAATQDHAYTYGGFVVMMVHLAAAKDSVEARQWLIDWGERYLETDAGAWNRFTEVLYAADLRELEPQLRRLATNSPDAQEGDSAIGTRRDPGLKNGARYHRARQVVAVWNEADAFTQAKALFLLGLNMDSRWGPDGLYTPRDRIEARLAEVYSQFDTTTQAKFAAFISWSQAAIPMTYQNRQYFERLVANYATTNRHQ